MKVQIEKLSGILNFDNLCSDTVVVGVVESDSNSKTRETLRASDDLTDGAVARFLKVANFEEKSGFGKFCEHATFYISPKNHKKVEKLILVGLGDLAKLDSFKVRRFISFVSKTLIKNSSSVALVLPHEVSLLEHAEVAVIGFSEGLFNSGHYKKNKDKDTKTAVSNVTFLTSEDSFVIQKTADKALIVSEAIDKTREIVNLPSNIVNPKYMADYAKKIALSNNLKSSIFTEKQVNEMGMGIMASVAKGSDEDLYFAVLEYRGLSKKEIDLAFVGKGITFDSGGISIKPGEQMDWMKMDMAGAAAVLGAIDAISKLKLKINLVVACPLTENLPSGKATKPGDVVKGLNGKTVEVINTDAEGRLVLADAISYVQNIYKPKHIVDVATLTGAAIVALGNVASAVLGKPKEFVDDVCDMASKSGEKFWPFPLYEEYREMLKSYIADIANISSVRGGGVETGAKFIEEFVDKKVNWAHLDIAPTAWEENEKPYAAKGASGIPVLTLVNLATKISEKSN